MVKVHGPALSLDASGSLGGAIVFSKWKGRNYIRELVIPANPRSGAQTGVRSMFKFLAQEWAGIAGADQATWQDRADNLVASQFNAFMSFNQRRWRDFNSPTQAEPPALLSTAPDGCTGVATPGVRTMTLAITHGVNLMDWGCAIFRSLTAVFDLTWDKVIAVVPCDGAGDAAYVDAPLVPDTYYYNTVGFNDDGVKGADGTEFSGVIP